MTPVDTLSTLVIMGLDDESKTTTDHIAKNLSFDKDISVSNFEITIRILGGLISAHQSTGDKRLLVNADDLGTRLLPAFKSKTGMPYRFVNLRRPAPSTAWSRIPAEIGTLLLEWGTLSEAHRRSRIYFDTAQRALVALYNHRDHNDRPRRAGDQRRDGAVDEQEQPRRRRDRFVLRVPVEVRKALRRSRVRRDVSREHRRRESLRCRRDAERPVVRTRRHDHRQAQRHQFRLAARIPPRRTGDGRRPRPRAAPAGLRFHACGRFTASSPNRSTTSR